jgi:hypothetical protein
MIALRVLRRVHFTLVIIILCHTIHEKIPGMLSLSYHIMHGRRMNTCW